jgi:hypothetical protein
VPFLGTRDDAASLNSRAAGSAASVAVAAGADTAPMDGGSLNGVEELVLGMGLAVTACIALGLARRLLAYALSAGVFVVGLAAVAALFVYKPSRVYGWVEREAEANWSRAPSSEELVDQGLAALHWLEDRLTDAKATAAREAEPPPAAAPAHVQPDAEDDWYDEDPPVEPRSLQASGDR